MTRISQLIAVVGGVTTETDARMAELRTVAANPNLMNGLEKTYRPRREDGAQLPPKQQLVRVTARDVLATAAAVLTRKWDIGRTLDEANTRARADVVVGGETLLRGVPPGHLLYLERELSRLADLIAALPVTDQTKEWAEETAGVHASVPVETESGDKVPYNWHRGNGTANFQEQVDVLTRDEVAGYWTTVTLSGALRPHRKQAILDRISALRMAVKMAREEANSAQVEDQEEGEVIFRYLLSP